MRKAAGKEAADIYSDGTYKRNNPDWDAADSPWKAAQIEKMLKRNDLNPSSFCEVGCGAGEILRQLSLKLDAREFVGYETSPDAFALCAERQSERVRFFLRDVLNEAVRHDCLLCIDVFEHVEDYMGFIRGLREKGEYKIFHIPLDVSVSSVLTGSMLRARREVGHLHYFTPDTALATLRDCGYEVLDFFYTPAFADLPGKTFRAKLARWPRFALYAVSPKLLSTLLGGCSLLVLAR